MSNEITIPEFSTPEFLLNHSEDDLHEMMKEILPSDLDISEGSHTWNYTRPTALVAAYLCEYIFPEVIRLILPEFSYGEFLDNHAKSRNLSRKPATAASGEITITGDVNSIIPKGSLFATASVNDEPSMDYKTLEEVVIPEEGVVTVRVQCTKTGIIGNTTEQTVVLVGSKLKGITGVINEEKITGGTEAERDEDLIVRILEYDRTLGISYTGCLADYKRWAKEVPGVGDAIPIEAQDDSGLVTIILTDYNGAPANETLCTDVYNHIMCPNDNPEQRLTNPNARLLVIPPYTIDFSMKATIELVKGYTIEGVRAALSSGLASYFPQASDEAEIKYSRVWAILSAVEGVNDFNDLQIGVVEADGSANYGTQNIPIEKSQLPTVDENDLLLTAGSV